MCILKEVATVDKILIDTLNWKIFRTTNIILPYHRNFWVPTIFKEFPIP